MLFLFFSGLAGLLYEVLWSRYLSLFLGNTTLAHTFVLTAFMGGLSIGNFLFGRIADKHPKRLWLYGWLELGIALWCGLYPVTHQWITQYYFSLVTLETPKAMTLLLQAGFCFATLLPATILMGGTLPVLSREIIRHKDEIDKGVASLYTANSLGAVVGTLLTGFILIQYCGLDFSTTVGTFVNAGVGLFALLASKFSESNKPKGVPSSQGQEVLPERTPSASLVSLKNALLAAIGVSGFCAMLYELAWTRAFALVLGSSTYAFTLMLAAFILGIVIGSAIISWRSSKTTPIKDRRLFGICQIAIAISLILTIPFYDTLPHQFGWLLFLLKTSGAPFWIYQSLCFSICFLLMLLPTLFSGFCLPLTSRLVSSDLKILGRDIGSVFAVNTLGTIAGSILTGLVLLPTLGIEGTFLLGIGLSLANGIILFLSALSGSSVRKFAYGALPALGFALFVAWGPRWNVSALNAGEFRKNTGAKPDSFSSFMKHANKLKTLYYKDGANGSILVQEALYGERFLKINGKADASTSGDLHTQLLLGHIPMTLLGQPSARQPLRVLIIGLGSGMTAASVLSYPDVEVDVVEISPEVAEAGVHFAPFNHDVLKNPRLHLYIEDAKAYLRLTKKKYHLIVSEPSNPWMAGVGGLFSIEHFKAAQAILQPGGIMVQWFHLYEMDDDILLMIIRTFLKAFPSASVWSLGRADIALMGSNADLQEDFQAMKKRLNHPEVAGDLSRIKVYDLATLLSMQILEQPNLSNLVNSGPINSDFFPYLEYKAPKSFYRSAMSNFLSHFDARRWARPKEKTTLLARYLNGRTVTSQEMKDMILYYDFIGEGVFTSSNLYPSILEKAISQGPPLSRLAYIRFARWKANHGDLTGAIELIQKIIHEPSASAEDIFFYVGLLHQYYRQSISSLHKPDYQPILSALKRCQKLNPHMLDAYLHEEALVYQEWGEVEKAIARWEAALAVQDQNKTSHISRETIQKGLTDADLRLRLRRNALQKSHS